MARLKAALLSLVVTALPFGVALAQIAGRPIEISGGAGISAPDARAHRKDGAAYAAGLGWRVLPNLTLEGAGLWAPSKADSGIQGDFNFSLLSLNARWNLRPADQRTVPFVTGGFGVGNSHRE